MGFFGGEKVGENKIKQVWRRNVHRTSLAFAVIVLCCWRATKGDAQTATTERQKATVFLFASPRGGKGGEKKKNDLPGNKKGLARSRATWRRERESATEADGANCVGLAQQGTWLTNRNPPSPLFQVTHWNERQINKQKHFFSSAKHVFIAGAAASPPHTRTCTEHSAQHSTEPPAQAQRPRKKNGPFFFFRYRSHARNRRLCRRHPAFQISEHPIA